jgi:3',5'-cyclic AMP phosphodiesterase CpdA
VRERLPQLLNLVNQVDQLDFIVILGDAFYDVQGGLTAEFWDQLSFRTQQVLVLAVPGNHDFWMFAPQAVLSQDQLGFGFAQWYAQDTAGAYLNRTLQPDSRTGLPGAEHFFFYHAIGDLGFIGYSGAHAWESQAVLFREACEHFSFELPNALYLLGHWDEGGLGCVTGMDVPRVYERLRTGHCARLADRLRYFMGHKHCNAPTADGKGFLLGAGGANYHFSGSAKSFGCEEWGFAYLDTRTASPPQIGETLGQARHMITKFTVATGAEEIVHIRSPPLHYSSSCSRGQLREELR